MTVSASPAEENGPDVRSTWPCHEQDECDAVVNVLKSGKVNALVHGEQCDGFAAEFAEFIGGRHAICMANGTATLEIALRSLGVGPGDEVIVPARSFFATASCVIAVGARPVFADILAHSQNLDTASAERLVGPLTKAIICVHLAGWPCDMAGLMDVCQRHGLLLIEDCAQAHGAAIDGRKVGSFGDAASFSFCTDKIMSTGGEGGLLLLREEAVFERAWSLKDHGKSRPKLDDGKGVPGQFRYVHDVAGTNARMTEMQAAIGRAQLRKLPQWLTARARNADFLSRAMEGHPLLVAPKVPENITHAWYKYYLSLHPKVNDPADRRAGIIERLLARGIPCGSGSCPDMSQELGLKGIDFRRDGSLSAAHSVGERTLMLLVDHTLDQEDMARVAETLWQVAA